MLFILKMSGFTDNFIILYFTAKEKAQWAIEELLRGEKKERKVKFYSAVHYIHFVCFWYHS